MRFEKLRDGFGMLALAASFALASPGVNVVKAEVVAGHVSPEQCSAAAQPQRSANADLAKFLEDLRKQQPDLAEGANPEGVVMLNNRGYNYGPARGVDLDSILAEANSRR